MLIVGELINSSRREIKCAVKCRDAKMIQDLAVKQIEAGCSYIDVNCGTEILNESEIMEWLVGRVKEICDTPLCIDSPSEKALAVGLKLAAMTGIQPMVNSITAERKRYAAILPLVKEYNAKVVALCIDDNGMPKTSDDSIRLIDKLVTELVRDGVEEDQIYIDPLVSPISTSETSGLEVLKALRYIQDTYSGVHTICGLSNVSFGLPNRKVLNRVFLIQVMTFGMDAFILDPLDKEMMAMFYAAQTLLGKDKYCLKYLTMHRQGLFESL